MSSKKVVAVIGATGSQGGSVAQYLLKDGTFIVRAITRNPDGAAAKALALQGAQVVQADSNELASLLKAFEGAYGVFAVTDFREPSVGFEGEVAQGKQLVDAAKASGVEHFVFSTLDHSEFKPPHWETKAGVNDYLIASGLPRTSLYTSVNYENFRNRTGLPLKKREDGSYDFPLPLVTDASFPVFSVAETGAYVLAALKNPAEWINKDLRIASEFISVRQIGKVLSDVSGKTVHVQEVTPELFKTFKGGLVPEGFHAGFSTLFSSNKASFRDVELSRKLNPGVKMFRAWAEENTTDIFN